MGASKSHGKSPSFSHAAGVQLGGGERSPRKGAWRQPLQKDGDGTRQASSRLQEPCLALQEGFTLSFGRGMDTYGSRQESERVHPWEHASPPEWPSHPSGPSTAKGASVTRNPAGARALRHSKNHGWKKKPISKITLYFFVVEFTLMYCNLKGSEKTTCKRVSK